MTKKLASQFSFVSLFTIFCVFLFGFSSVNAATPTPSKNSKLSVDNKLLKRSPSFLDPSKVALGSVRAAIFQPGSNTLLYSKNANSPAPIASITKLMMAMVILDAKQPLEEYLTIKKSNRKTEKNGYSRIRLGSQLRRRDLLRIALMASENRAASTLAFHYPGGFDAFVLAMNKKAKLLGMTTTYFYDATGLSLENVSTAADLVLMVTAAEKYELIKEYSTTKSFTARFKKPRYVLGYGNTNRLVHRDSWNILVTKTGYLTEAGRCLVMVTDIDDEPVVMVFLDSFGKLTPVGDAGRIRRWMTTGAGGRVAGAAANYEKTKSAAYR
ncbi:MAG: D-alanyl-D-alanine endopeptidase [Cellvibrionaceae bacterium]